LCRVPRAWHRKGRRDANYSPGQSCFSRSISAYMRAGSKVASALVLGKVVPL
jgi:hypothetical protein